ncbi:MAG TPA: TIGR02281 family clan AA aspartic protease [Gammaproteobacteria bacterium]|nr:TIGR02281 family clan AA aspartic protease [Gammaproteobacteria bacterium]
MSETRRIGLGMSILAWGLLLLLLSWFAADYLQLQRNPNSQVTVTHTAEGVPQVTLLRNHSGHYVATGAINGSAVTFLLDTGATDVAIDEHQAALLGLKKGASVIVSTANGKVKGWRTLLRKVELGSIELPAVPATIVPDLNGEALLGMSFLKRLTMIQRGRELTLRQE